MSKLEFKDCPQPETLSDFLLGKLDPESSQQCESHLAECEPCVETISELNVSDTFQSLVADAGPVGFDSQSESVVDKGVVSNLIHRLSDVGKRTNATGQSSDLRAADVVALLSPSDSPEGIGQIDHYRIENVLGCGSTGVVFGATDQNLDRPVAIKVLRPSLGDAARQRFIAEARATANLNHANIVTIFHVGETETVAYIVMQWLPGETLEQRLDRESILDSATVKNYGSQIAKGLAKAHEKSLIHRDIKPANLWITEDNHVKILDFGLVRIMDESPQLTCTGMIAGTPCFMSPEQSRGDELDARSDLFSLGCVIYRCLTGKLPFVSANALATLQAIQRVAPEPPKSLEPSVDQDLSDLAMSLLEKSPHRRPGCADDVVQAIESARCEWPFKYQAMDVATVANSLNPKPEPEPIASGLDTFWGRSFTALTLGLIGFAAFAFWPQIIRVATNQGEIVIESNDPDVQIEVLDGGKQVEIIDLKTDQSIQIQSGTYQIRALGDKNSVSIDKETLTLSRGETEIVTVKSSPSENPDVVNVANSKPNGAVERPTKANTVKVARTEYREPVYNGMTYSECLNAVKYERDAKKLSDPCIGLMELKDAEDSEDIREDLLQAMLRIERSNIESEAPLRFTRWLTDEQFQNLALEFTTSRDQSKWSLFSVQFIRGWNRLRPVEDKLVANVISAAENDTDRSRIPNYVLLSILKPQIELTKSNTRKVFEFLLTYAQSDENNKDYFRTLARSQPAWPGLGEAMCKPISKCEDPSELTFWENRLHELDEANQMSMIHVLARKVVELQSEHQYRFLRRLSYDQFMEIEPTLNEIIIPGSKQSGLVAYLQSHHKNDIANKKSQADRPKREKDKPASKGGLGDNIVPIPPKTGTKKTAKTEYSEPVYDGLTFDECFNAVRYEYDAQKLIKPCIGLMELKDSSNSQAVRDALLPAVLRIHKKRSDLKSDVPKQFVSWLSKEEVQELSLELTGSEDPLKWSLFYCEIMGNWERIRPVEDELVSNIVAGAKNLDGSNSANVLANIIRNGELSEANTKKAIEGMIAYAKTKQSRYYFEVVTSAEPSWPGLGEAMCDPVSNSEDGEIGYWLDLYVQLGNENKKAVVKTHARRILEMKDSNSRLLRDFSNLPNEMLLEIEPVLKEFVAAKSEAALSLQKMILRTKKSREKTKREAKD